MNFRELQKLLVFKKYMNKMNRMMSGEVFMYSIGLIGHNYNYSNLIIYLRKVKGFFLKVKEKQELNMKNIELGIENEE